MADKIVQLKDKNSNNLYPVSGSSLTDSVSSGAIVDGAVTTAKIADSSITAAKIADATFQGTITNVITASGGNPSAVYGNPLTKIGVLRVSIRPSTALAANTTTTVQRSSIRANGAYAAQFALQGVNSGSQCGIVTLDGGAINVWVPSSYQNWVRASICFIMADD